MTTETPTVKQELERKLDPRRFTAMSGKMAAIVGFILNTERWETEPAISELLITSDGGVLAAHDGGMFNDFIGAKGDLMDNLRRLVKAAELTPKERAAFWKLYRNRVDDRTPVGRQAVLA